MTHGPRLHLQQQPASMPPAAFAPLLAKRSSALLTASSDMPLHQRLLARQNPRCRCLRQREWQGWVWAHEHGRTLMSRGAQCHSPREKVCRAPQLRLQVPRRAPLVSPTAAESMQVTPAGGGIRQHLKTCMPQILKPSLDCVVAASFALRPLSNSHHEALLGKDWCINTGSSPQSCLFHSGQALASMTQQR